MTAKSRSGLVITYAGCPITGAFRMQTLMSLSMTKAEYVITFFSIEGANPIDGTHEGGHMEGDR